MLCTRRQEFELDYEHLDNWIVLRNYWHSRPTSATRCLHRTLKVKFLQGAFPHAKKYWLCFLPTMCSYLESNPCGFTTSPWAFRGTVLARIMCDSCHCLKDRQSKIIKKFPSWSADRPQVPVLYFCVSLSPKSVQTSPDWSDYRAQWLKLTSGKSPFLLSLKWYHKSFIKQKVAIVTSKDMSLAVDNQEITLHLYDGNTLWNTSSLQSLSKNKVSIWLLNSY